MLSSKAAWRTSRLVSSPRSRYSPSRSAQLEQSRRTEDFLRQNLNAMAVKLGEMQAQLMRLDALGERLSSAAGIRPGDFRFGEVPARGGALPGSAMARDLSLSEFS